MIAISTTSWTEYKSLVISTKNLPFQYTETAAYYTIYAAEVGVYLWTYVLYKDGGADVTDFEDNYKALGNKPIESRDADGSLLARTKITATGWHFQAHSIEWTTSTLASVYNADSSGNDLGFATVKFYDSNDAEITTAPEMTGCVKTVIDWEPTFDYEMVGGSLHHASVPGSNCRLYVIAVPDIPAAYGGSIFFAQGGINLNHVGATGSIRLDGRAPKRLTYDATNHTNKLRFILKHTAGLVYTGMIVLELYKASA